MPSLSHYYYSNRHTPTPTPPPISPPFSPSPSMYGPPIPPPGRNSWARSPIYPPYYYPSSSDSETTTPPPPPAASQLTQHFSSPNPFPAQKDATSLPSRVAALNRRAALVAKNLEHLTQVVKPLESVKAADVGMNHLRDVHTVRTHAPLFHTLSHSSISLASCPYANLNVNAGRRRTHTSPARLRRPDPRGDEHVGRSSEESEGSGEEARGGV